MPKTYESTAVKTDRSSMLPEGVHRVRVVDFEEKMGGSGYPYWAFTLEITGSDWEGQTLWNNVSLSPQARFKMDEWLDGFSTPEGETVHGEEFLGKYCRVKIKHGEYQGKKRPEIETVLPDAKPKRTRGSKTAIQEEIPFEVSGVSAEETGDVRTDKGLPGDVVPSKTSAKKRPF